ncbi:16S rRNA (cytosine(1402)-N(4))-methyltransferase RsmH [Candidatus Daviesbacteria bacterium]|nr:16S rRNA (cytosine(1402)-N(4))-methyltransferase RsmH [Candidatus Daviesbacteria bacterium]
MNNLPHQSVMLKEVVEALGVKAGHWYLDATLGAGGHSLEILRLGGKVFGIDADPLALKITGDRFQAAGISSNDYILKEGNFRDIDQLAGDLRFTGVVFDLGVSSMQLDDPSRGFSFKGGPLDMRMSLRLGVKASDLLQVLTKGELYGLFKTYAQEPNAGRIAEAVVSARKIRPITTAQQLAEVIVKAGGRKRGKIHPATLVFQALRMVVNDELDALQEGLPKALGVLEPNAKLAVISFHSGEDRIVKNLFRQWANQGLGQIVTSKPVIPTLEEVGRNPRSRSAKLRIFKKDKL